MKRDHHAGRELKIWRTELGLRRDARRARKAQEAAGKAGAAPEPAPAAPRGVLRIARAAALWAIAAIIAVASGAAFAESYRGLYEWALRHGLSGFWAAAFPLQVDSFIGVGELVLFVATVDRWKLRHRAGAWAVALLGLAVSVAGNIGHVAAHDAQSRGTAAVPPVAAFAALWLGLAVLKRVLERAAEDRAEPVAPAPPEPPAVPVPEVIAPEVAGTAYEAARVAYVASVRGGNALSERGLASRFGIPRGDARKILAEVVTGANGYHPQDVPDSTVP